MASFAVGRPATLNKILLNWPDQFIQAWIKNRAMVHVHHIMALAPIKTGLNPTTRWLDWNDRPIAITHHRCGRNNRFNLDA